MKLLNQEAQQKIIQKIAKWKAGLADLGRKNPLIKFQPDNRRTLEVLTDELDIIFTDFVEKKKTFKFSIVDSDYQDNVLSSTKALSSSKNPLELITRQTGNEQLKRLKTLRAEARKSIEERGFNSLFLAMGTLTWYDKDKPEEALLSPLILIPVDLNKEPRREIYKISALEDDIVINPTLTQKLKQNFGLELPDIEAIQEPTYKKIIEQIKLVLVGQKLWKINDSVFISLFSYAKSAIVKDITENETRIFSHPILQAISGDVTNYESNHREPLPEYALDSQVKPEKIFQILDADSSQQVVIEAAKAGSSFVVQGPPGTGKSQTIVNMIAELVGAGKSVLLVAEKETALSVVYKRMAECGLDHVCLNLHHSGTTDKKKLVNNLSKTIDYLAQISTTENYHNFFEQLVSTRQLLNSYLTSLHTKEQPLNKSAFELYGDILQKERQGVPNINVILSNFNQWNQSRLVEAKNLLNQLAQFLPLFKGEKTTIWSKSSLKSYSYELELEIREKLADFQQAILATQKLSQQSSSIIQLQPVSNLESLETYYQALSYVSKAPLQLPENWTQVNVAIARNAFNILRQDVREIAMRTSSPKALDLLNYLSSFIPFLKALRNNKPNPIVALRNKLSQVDYLPNQIFGSLFHPQMSSEDELKPIEAALDWLIGLQHYSLPGDAVQQIINVPSRRRELSEIVNEFSSNVNEIKQGWNFILSYFREIDITDSYLTSNKITFEELERFLNLAESELQDFQGWLTYKETCEKLENLVNKKFIDALRDSQIEPEQWYPSLEKLIYKTCIDAIWARKIELKNFNTAVHEQRIKEFFKLDSSQLYLARERLKRLHLQRWQNREKASVIQCELPKLKKEVTKRRQHLPIRKLLNDKQKGIPNLVKALKPCWMMSPLAVSQYIDANEVHFDVVIFDEASQLRTEDVVPSIIRADQVIIIGDRKQLPPTSFFKVEDNDEDVIDEDNANAESVLDECSNFMFGRTIKWHYRSRDERLIAFSNKHFYDSQLVTFPNPIQNPDLGVKFKHVPDGVYDRAGRKDNQREAHVVAQLALEHFQRVPAQSLGIIAFSEAQADAIQEQIEILGKDNPDFEAFCNDNSPQFFLKALENVQGDERDAIILSVGYGYDADGKLNLNFGPINKQGGERRLNVAVTRAKCKITLVSSIVAGDIDLSRSKSEGLRLLRDYLEYAASGGERLEGNFYTDQIKFDSPFEEDVYHALTSRGYIIRSQIGCSGYRIDLAVVNKNRPGEFLLGIECDGASYHSSPTARDRDRLRQQVLENFGWKIHRIWSTDWFRNKPAQVNLLVEKIAQLQQT